MTPVGTCPRPRGVRKASAQSRIRFYLLGLESGSPSRRVHEQDYPVFRIAIVAFVLAVTFASAQQSGSPAEAKAMLEHAVFAVPALQ